MNLRPLPCQGTLPRFSTLRAVSLSNAFEDLRYLALPERSTRDVPGGEFGGENNTFGGEKLMVQIAGRSARCILLLL